MTEPAKESPGKRAIRYAEEKLGVHTEYQDAIQARESLDTTLTELSKWRDARRMIEDQITDRETDIIIDERGKHSDMSQAGMDRHLKIVFKKDTYLADRHVQLNKTISEIDGLEMDRIIAEKNIAIAVARMTELGGYFQYLATVKTAETERKHNASSLNAKN